MKTASEIVDYLVRHYQQNSEVDQEDLLLAQVDDLVHDMGELLAKRLQEDTPYTAVWEIFTQSPNEYSDSLIGILEALFEAQPGLYERVESFMEKITAIEAENADEEFTPENIESDLQLEPGGIVDRNSETSEAQVDREIKKNPPIYLYSNEREGVESDCQAPISKPFIVGENAQIIYAPTEKVQFPSMFMHLGRITETAEDLSLEEKQIVQEHLQSLRDQLTEVRAFDIEVMANDFESIWEVATQYADVLIESLQNNLQELPNKARNFIIQLDSSLH